MEDLMRDTSDDEGNLNMNNDKTTTDMDHLTAALDIIQKDSNFSIPFSQSADNKMKELLDSIQIPFVRRASRHCFRYMNGYRLGLIGPELDYAIRKYKGHRMIPPENLQLIKDEFKKQQDDKMKSSFKSC